MAGNSGGQHKPVFELYYSFAPQDEALCLELEKHLKPLERQNLVTCWHRWKVPVGTDVALEVEATGRALKESCFSSVPTT